MISQELYQKVLEKYKQFNFQVLNDFPSLNKYYQSMDKVLKFYYNDIVSTLTTSPVCQFLKFLNIYSLFTKEDMEYCGPQDLLNTIDNIKLKLEKDLSKNFKKSSLVQKIQHSMSFLDRKEFYAQNIKSIENEFLIKFTKIRQEANDKRFTLMDNLKRKLLERFKREKVFNNQLKYEL